YEAIAGDRSVPQAFREAATIRAAYLLADTSSAADLQARLTPLDKPDSVWRLPIREVYALAAWREGRYEDAFKLASEIAADPAAPQGMRQRAQIMAAGLQPRIKANTGGGDDQNRRRPHPRPDGACRVHGRRRPAARAVHRKEGRDPPRDPRERAAQQLAARQGRDDAQGRGGDRSDRHSSR